METNISNHVEAIYLSAFALGQDIELQVMTAWVHLSMDLLSVINLTPLKLLNIENAVFRTAFSKHTDLKSQRDNIFCL